MKLADINWRPVSEKPNKPGRYLIWSFKAGIRLTSFHPEWWNTRAYPEVQRVTLFAEVGTFGIQQQLQRLAKGKSGQ
jgi:hypothetical protein